MIPDAGRKDRIEALGFDVSALELERVARCNLCGSGHHVEVARRDRYGFAVRSVFCADCGLGFLSPRPAPAVYGRFYEHVYRPLVSAYHGRHIDAETIQQEQAIYATELVTFLRSAVEREPRTVLDIGGSTGVVGAAMRDAFGSTVTVVDPSPDELAVAAANGLETVAGFAETADLGGRRFDLVLLCQTVDHLVDVATSIAAIRSWLAPGGIAFVDVLDVRFVAWRLGAVEAAAKIDHPHYLTRETARGFFDLAGLRVVSERLADDGHWGFLLEPSEAVTPDWRVLRGHADELLRELWRLRARG